MKARKVLGVLAIGAAIGVPAHAGDIAGILDTMLSPLSAGLQIRPTALLLAAPRQAHQIAPI